MDMTKYVVSVQNEYSIMLATQIRKVAELTTENERLGQEVRTAKQELAQLKALQKPSKGSDDKNNE